jgi:hypothetical protein
MYTETGLALYRDLYRLLMIRISKDHFNVKKHRGLYLDFSNVLREKSVTSQSYTFLKCK